MRTSRQGAGRGLYRIFNSQEYRFYRGATPPVEGDSPYATASSLPSQPATVFADGTWYLSMSYFDGILDSGFLPVGPRGETYLTLTVASGSEQPQLPGAPYGVALKLLAGGIIQVVGFYGALADGDNAATAWSIAFTTDGTSPTPPPATPGPTDATFLSMTGSALQILSYRLPAQVIGTVVKVLVQVARQLEDDSFVYSAAGEVLSLTVNNNGPSAPLAGSVTTPTDGGD